MWAQRGKLRYELWEQARGWRRRKAESLISCQRKEEERVLLSLYGQPCCLYMLLIHIYTPSFSLILWFLLFKHVWTDETFRALVSGLYIQWICNGECSLYLRLPVWGSNSVIDYIILTCPLLALFNLILFYPLLDTTQRKYLTFDSTTLARQLCFRDLTLFTHKIWRDT